MIATNIVRMDRKQVSVHTMRILIVFLNTSPILSAHAQTEEHLTALVELG